MSNSRIKIAILGATSHIAKGLIFFMRNNKSVELYLFGRNIEKINGFLDLIKFENSQSKPISSLKEDRYDMLINCVGYGSSFESSSTNETIFELTERFDQICIEYIRKFSDTTFINLSSGAVYGTSFLKPVTLTSKACLDVNNILPEDYYRIAKLNSETKHRLLSQYKIIDLRIFGYFSRFIDLTKNYLMTDIVMCVKKNKVFKTSSLNIVRDYVHPEDLTNLIISCFDAKINQPIDIKSLNPISKFEILDFFKQNYGLKFELSENIEMHSQTGEKLNYYSENPNTNVGNYIPKYTSLECIKMETLLLLKPNS